jgi:homoserine dehydrogenase
VSAAPLRIGLAGLGTVGAGVAALLRDNAGLIAARAGRAVTLKAVSARDRGRDRGVDLSGLGWEADPVALARRDDIDALVEAIGGSNGPAREACEAALAAGRHLVTANKALLAHHGAGLAQEAERAGLALRFEAAVAGGVPIVKALGEGLAANRLSRVYGVLNGTCNYILTEMERAGRDYAAVLAEAQAKGFAEADPRFDVGGIDAAHKLALLASLAFGCDTNFAGVSVEGIERLSLADIAHAGALGYRVKLLGVARRLEGDAVERAVRPCLVRADSAIGQLDGVTNAVVCEGDAVGQAVFEGPGAGAGPTASAIVADLIDIARGARGPAFGVPATTLRPLVSTVETPAPHYLRFRLQDRPGALAEIARDLGDEGVSIRAMRQDDERDGSATVVILTHACARGALDRALAAIATSSVSLARPVALTIENV